MKKPYVTGIPWLFIRQFQLGSFMGESPSTLHSLLRELRGLSQNGLSGLHPNAVLQDGQDLFRTWRTWRTWSCCLGLTHQNTAQRLLENSMAPLCWLGYCQFVMRIQHNNSPHLMVTQTARVREQICAIALHYLIQICIITEWIFLFWTRDLLFSCLCQN